MANDPQIETPVSSGATDVPNAPQLGDAASNTARNVASAQGSGYPVQQGPPDYAYLAQKYGVGISAATAVQNSPAAPAASKVPTAPAAQGLQAAQPGTPDYAALAAKHGVSISASQTQAQDQSASAQKPGFVSTVASDIGGAATGLAKLPLKVAEYATLSAPSTADEQAIMDARDAQKKAIYQQFKDDFHAGHYAKAFYGLTNLFDPHGEDPNDPLQQVMQAQWDSSKQAKDRAVEAVKNKDYAAAIQHAVGILPVASQVDAAMENYRKDPSRENLAHIVTSAIPAFIPAIAKGAGALVKNASESGELVNPLAPTNVDIAGQPVPVRSAVANPTLGGRIAEGLATKEPLQKFDLTQTQPAARAAIGRVAEESVTKPSFKELHQAESTGARTITTTFDQDTGDLLDESGKPIKPAPGQSIDDVITDRIQKLAKDAETNAAAADNYWADRLKNTGGDFGQAYRSVKAELSRFYQKADAQGMTEGQGENAFSQAQREEKAAFRSGNVNAEDTAIARQRDLFDKANGDGTYDAVRKLYPKLDAIDAINNKFTARAVIKNTPPQFLKDLPANQFDRGIIDGGALRTAVRELKADGTFAKAGVDDAHVIQLQRLGDLLERSKVRPDTVPAGIWGKAAQGVKTMTAGNQLAYLMTHADALDRMVEYLKNVGPAAIAVAQTGNITHRYEPESGIVLPIAP